MKLATLAILLIWALTSIGQSLREVNQLLLRKDFIAFKKYIDSASLKFTKTTTGTKAIWKELRDVTLEYQEAMIDIEEHFQNQDKPGIGSAYLYRLNMLTSAKEIICYEWRGRGMSDDFPYDFPVTDSFKNKQAFDTLLLSFRELLELNWIFKNYSRHTFMELSVILMPNLRN